MTPDEASLYALVHDGAPGDVQFYRSLTRGLARVLELGCGWGRVAGELDCGEVVGVESDAGMRALGERRGFHAIAGDMRRLDPETLGLFDAVIIPFTGLYCMLSEDDLRACLRSVRGVLAPGGQLVFDVYSADTFHRDALPEDYPDDQLDEVARVTHDGVELVVYERSRWDREAQRMFATYVYRDPHHEEAVATLEVPHRYVLSPQFAPLLEAAGLRLVSMSGDFAGQPYLAEESGSIIVTACADRRRAPGA